MGNRLTIALVAFALFMGICAGRVTGSIAGWSDGFEEGLRTVQH